MNEIVAILVVRRRRHPRHSVDLAAADVHLAGPVELQRALLQLFVANGVTTVLNMRGA